MLISQGCHIEIESTSSSPSSITLRPNKFQDETISERIYSNLGGVGVITFNYTKVELHATSDSDLTNVEIKFHIEPADNSYTNYADNFVEGTYQALINGHVSNIPRPVGKLSNYIVRLNSGQTNVPVGYIASDVSGIYQIVGEAYYRGNLVNIKKATVYVMIPELKYFPRNMYDLDIGMLWNFVGTTEFHISNNYVQE